MITKQSLFLEDCEIIDRVAGGEAGLFEILIRRNNQVIYKIARGFGFNHQDAEDLMQESHLAAFLELKTFEKRAAYRTWISRIMINKCLYKLKYGHYHREKPDSALINELSKSLMANAQYETANHITKKELAAIIENSLEKIPVLYRSVFVLREVEGFNVAETSELLNITPINVKVRLSRAKALLQKELESSYSSTDLYEFNLIYCDRIVNKVFQLLQSHI